MTLAWWPDGDRFEPIRTDEQWTLPSVVTAAASVPRADGARDDRRVEPASAETPSDGSTVGDGGAVPAPSPSLVTPTPSASLSRDLDTEPELAPSPSASASASMSVAPTVEPERERGGP